MAGWAGWRLVCMRGGRAVGLETHAGKVGFFSFHHPQLSFHARLAFMHTRVCFITQTVTWRSNACSTTPRAPTWAAPASPTPAPQPSPSTPPLTSPRLGAPQAREGAPGQLQGQEVEEEVEEEEWLAAARRCGCGGAASAMMAPACRDAT